MALFALERYDEAITVCRSVSARHPNHAGARRLMTVSLGLLGRIDEAKESLANTLALQPDFSTDHVAYNTVFAHEVRLMPAQYVKAYIKRNKNDAADAEAICEAVVRPTMRFVPAKTAEQQAAVLLHRGRERLVRQRTMLVNALRAHLAEFGVIAPQGLRNVGKLIVIIRDEEDARLPSLARQVLQVLAMAGVGPRGG